MFTANTRPLAPEDLERALSEEAMPKVYFLPANASSDGETFRAPEGLYLKVGEVYGGVFSLGDLKTSLQTAKYSAEAWGQDTILKVIEFGGPYISTYIADIIWRCPMYEDITSSVEVRAVETGFGPVEFHLYRQGDYSRRIAILNNGVWLVDSDQYKVESYGTTVSVLERVL